MTFLPRIARLALAAGLVTLTALAAVPVLAADHAVSIVDKAFEPAEITISAGDTVTWTVTRSIGEPHSVTAGTPGEPVEGAEFDSGTAGLRDEGQAFQHEFAEVGTFDYYCTVHPVEMTGRVVVTAAGVPAEPGEAEGIPAESKILAAGILAVSIVLMFGAAWVWRRMNPATPARD
jgi:plastocyanin